MYVQLKDPSLEFQRACIAVQRARDPMKVMAYYPVPEVGKSSIFKHCILGFTVISHIVKKAMVHSDTAFLPHSDLMLIGIYSDIRHPPSEQS